MSPKLVTSRLDNTHLDNLQLSVFRIFQTCSVQMCDWYHTAFLPKSSLILLSCCTLPADVDPLQGLLPRNQILRFGRISMLHKFYFIGCFLASPWREDLAAVFASTLISRLKTDCSDGKLTCISFVLSEDFWSLHIQDQSQRLASADFLLSSSATKEKSLMSVKKQHPEPASLSGQCQLRARARFPQINECRAMYSGGVGASPRPLNKRHRFGQWLSFEDWNSFL